jgi:hypothetical protein
MIKGGTPTRSERKSKDYPFEIRRSRIAGRGAFATRRIQPGQKVIEYVGEIITQKEADRRYPDGDNKNNHHTFLFEIDDKKVIDASYRGNEARFINHACQPNCEAVDDGGGGRIFIYAYKNIQPGVELTYDYSFPRQPGDGPKEEAQYPCHCGSRRCRGTIMEARKRKRKKKKKTADRGTRGRRGK